MARFLFRWSVAKDGHGPVLGNTFIGERADGGRARTYPLVEAPTLFLAFADLADDAESLIGFADLHGLLLGHGPEPLATWRGARRRMAQAVALFHAIREGNSRKAGERVRYAEVRPKERDGRASTRTFPELRLLWDGGREERIALTGELRGLADPSRPLRNARLALQVLVNRHLEDASPRLVIDSATDRQVIELVPETLLGAMWVQLARAVESDAGFTRCSAPGCTRWNPPSRDDRLTCSDACRKRRSRAGGPTDRGRRTTSR